MCVQVGYSEEGKPPGVCAADRYIYQWIDSGTITDGRIRRRGWIRGGITDREGMVSVAMSGKHSWNKTKIKTDSRKEEDNPRLAGIPEFDPRSGGLCNRPCQS